MERSHGKERHAPEIQGLMRTGAGGGKGKISQDRGRKLYCYLYEKRNDP